MAKPKFGDIPNAREKVVIDNSPPMMTGFLPKESVRCPRA